MPHLAAHAGPNTLSNWRWQEKTYIIILGRIGSGVKPQTKRKLQNKTEKNVIKRQLPQRNGLISFIHTKSMKRRIGFPYVIGDYLPIPEPCSTGSYAN